MCLTVNSVVMVRLVLVFGCVVRCIRCVLICVVVIGGFGLFTFMVFYDYWF